MTDDTTPPIVNPADGIQFPTAAQFGRYCNDQAEWLLTTQAGHDMRQYAKQRFDTLVGDETELNPHDWQHIAEDVHLEHFGRFADAPLYYLTGDMVEFVRHSADTMPGGGLRLEELPSRSGVMGFATPIMTMYSGFDADELGAAVIDKFGISGNGRHIIAGPVTALSWQAVTRTGHPDGVWMSAYLPASAGKRHFHLHFDAILPFTDHYDQSTPPDLTPADSELEDLAWAKVVRNRTAHVMHAAWLLLTQSKLTETEELRATRQQRRQAERNLQRPPRDINVVRVRARAHDTTRIQGMSCAELDGHRKHKVRYPVRGHQKQQFYGPGRALRRTIWIDPHWRGPDGAPIHYSRTVNLLDGPQGGQS